MLKAGLLTDRSRLLTYLGTDRLYAAYAIGDLELGMFEQCVWAVAEAEGRIQALVLRFGGLDPPVLFLMGEAGGLRAILERTLRPERVYATCRPERMSLVREFYDWDDRRPMWRMALRPSWFRPVAADHTQLSPAHAGQLAELFTGGVADAFSPAQLQDGIFYGVFVGGKLVAAAGTHLVSPSYGVAAVGNVFTHPDHRGCGHATVLTSAVVAELLARGTRDVVLNVAQDNEVAIRIYERLGFERYCPFVEGPAVLKGS